MTNRMIDESVGHMLSSGARTQFLQYLLLKLVYDLLSHCFYCILYSSQKCDNNKTFLRFVAIIYVSILLKTKI